MIVSSCISDPLLVYSCNGDTPARSILPTESTQTPTIWVANEAGHPYHKIRDKLGDVKIEKLSLGDVNQLRLDRLSWHLARGIARFVNDGDYLLISGSPVVNALALTLWLQMFPRCNLALWDAKNGEYIISYVERENLTNILQQHMQS